MALDGAQVEFAAKAVLEAASAVSWVPVAVPRFPVSVPVQPRNQRRRHAISRTLTGRDAGLLGGLWVEGCWWWTGFCLRSFGSIQGWCSDFLQIALWTGLQVQLCVNSSAAKRSASRCDTGWFYQSHPCNLHLLGKRWELVAGTCATNLLQWDTGRCRNCRVVNSTVPVETRYLVCARGASLHVKKRRSNFPALTT